jgi:Protein of unknown function (DUF3618)
MTEKEDRLTMPGQPPTDEDLRHDAELTRQELAQTVAALGEKANVKARVQEAAHEKAEALRERGDELVERLPAPVAVRVRPVVDGATRRPMIPLAGLLALFLVLRFWLKHRSTR